MEAKERSIVLRTYSAAWKYEKKIYAIDRFRLLVPVNPSEVLYFFIGLLITLGLLKVLPILNMIPAVIRYLLLPFALMKFLTKKKFDGKLPHKFLISYLDYLMLPSTIVRFQPGEHYRTGRFTKVIYRGKQTVDVTEELRKGRKQRV